MALKLFFHEKNNRSDKVLITAKYTGFDIEVVHEFDDKSPEFLSKNPTGKSPVLEVEDEFIAGSNAIIRYLALAGTQGLYGWTNTESGLIDQWVDFSSEVELASYAWIFPVQGIIPPNAGATKKAQEDIKRILQILDNHLLTRTYLVGNAVTLADIAVATTLQKLYELVLDPAFRGPFINTNRWFTTIVNQPNYKDVVPHVKLTDVAAVPPTPAGKKEKTEKKPKKEEPKKVEKEEEDPEVEEEEEEVVEKKSNNPLDLLPKSKLVLDEWKRKYSNNDTRAVSIPWFYENFDKEGYSLWWCDYMHDDLNEQLFKASNFIGGFFQRAEALHKYAFASMLIFEETPKEGEQYKWSIGGVWLFRGVDIPQIMQVVDDYVNYKWRRVDLENPEERKLFEDYLSWEGSFGGRKYVDGKIFK